MFIGAHPDDEAGQLGTLGYWNEYHGMKAGVITTTRGEGGGNATGLEEGPGSASCGRPRSARPSAGPASSTSTTWTRWTSGTASAPLTEEVWGHQETLSRIVRVLRTTKPEVILTMNPSATQGNHGNHQKAAMLAVEAFYAAADPKAFPEQIKKEGLKPWRVSRIFQTGGSGTARHQRPRLRDHVHAGRGQQRRLRHLAGLRVGAPRRQPVEHGPDLGPPGGTCRRAGAAAPSRRPTRTRSAATG
ncbi:PIG-L family deacetylase [Micromonospora sp. BRA006-A]|nr:PIG-L family deacetylase [Micromonospora sp. BRA006-A]